MDQDHHISEPPRTPSPETDTDRSEDGSEVSVLQDLTARPGNSPVFTGSDISEASSPIDPPGHLFPFTEPVELNSNESPLFCEFAALSGCNTIFRRHEFWPWVQHIADEHLGQRFPNRSRCWFCDDVEFEASQNDGDRQNTFFQRMEHIYQHIHDDGYTVEQIRPDFDFLEHLHLHSLIGDDMYQWACQYEEGRTNVSGRAIEQGDTTKIQQTVDQCLTDILVTDPRDDKRRLQDTKGGLLSDCYVWVLDNPEFCQWRENENRRLLWVKGDPGKGKTMLLCGIIDELEKVPTEGMLLSYFFCQATDERTNTATAVLRGLIFMLLEQDVSLLPHLPKKYDTAGKLLFANENAWQTLSEIFRDILRDPRAKRPYLVVDALDECVTGLPHLINLISETSRSIRAKWLVSSRNRLQMHQRPIIFPRGQAEVHDYILSMSVKVKPSQPDYNIDDFSDIESLISLVSLESDTTSLSSHSVMVAPVAASELVDLLINDEEMKNLIETGYSELGLAQCVTICRRLLKVFGQSLRQEASTHLQIQTAIFVRRVAGEVSAQLQRRLAGKQHRRLHLVGVDRRSEDTERLNSWLHSLPGLSSDDSRRDLTVATELQDADDMASEPGSETQEADGPPPLTALQQVKDFILFSQALPKLRSDMRQRLAPKQETGEAQPPDDQISPDINCMHDGSLESAESRLESDLTFQPGSQENAGTNALLQWSWFRGLKQLCDALKALPQRLADFISNATRRKTPPGYTRILWRSARGRLLYMDLKTTSKEEADKIQALFTGPGSLAPAAGSSTPQYATASSPPQRLPGAYLPQPQTGATLARPGIPRSTSYHLVQMPALPTTSASTQRHRDIRFLLLCLNTRRLTHYVQIEITDILDDNMLFREIRHRHQEVMAKVHPVWHRMLPEKFRLSKPKQVDFVQFTLMPIGGAHRPFGITTGLPPQAEVDCHNWHYHPCPASIEHFQLSEAFVTTLLEPGHAHERDAWSLLFPKKLRTGFGYTYPNPGVAWGIHIVEGRNDFAIIFTCFLVALTSGILGVAYSVFTGDAGAGFTIASWYATTTALGITCLQLYP